ncbi:MAG TPA: hypothetical protein ENI27_06985 [bacterium]|nr:hypothetical protein [bacterium]
MYSYFAYGLGIHSDLPLPELISSKVENDVVIHVGSLDSIPPEALGNQPFLKVHQKEAILSLGYVGTFIVRSGREITIIPFPDADIRLIQRYLVGIIMGIVLYQRGLLVLHASAINILGSAVALLGCKGSGKSSLAAALYKRKHDLIVDDITAVEMNNGLVKVFPGFPQIKLSVEAADAIGCDPNSLRSLDKFETKQSYRLEKGFVKVPMPLSRIYLLSAETDFQFTRLTPQAAVIELVRHSYPTRWVLPGDAAHFQQCIKLANEVPIYRINRPFPISKLSEWAQLIEEHVLVEDVGS